MSFHQIHSPVTGLRAELHALRDLLAEMPRVPWSVLRVCTVQVIHSAEVSEKDDAAAELLRTLLEDLSSGKPVDTRHYATELTLAADRIDA